MKPTGRMMALDYGRRRIGVAVSDETGMLARPLAVVVRENRRADMRKLRELMRDQGVKKVIVGHPVMLDGIAGEMAEETARFAKRIEKECGVKVELVDERLTSWAAEQIQSELGTKGEVDAVAAAVMLREYLSKKAK